jgi:hypothetical protein
MDAIPFASAEPLKELSNVSAETPTVKSPARVLHSGVDAAGSAREGRFSGNFQDWTGWVSLLLARSVRLEIPMAVARLLQRAMVNAGSAIMQRKQSNPNKAMLGGSRDHS